MKKVLGVVLFSFFVACSIEDEMCINSFDCPENMVCNQLTGACEEDLADTGNTGDTGDTGDSGNTADTGNSGNTGNTGDSGNSGDTGDTGNTGNTGNTGDSGNSGNTGDTGNDETVNDPDQVDLDNEINDEASDEIPDEITDETVDETTDEAADEIVSDDDTAGPVTVVNYTFNSGAEGWTHQKIDSATASWPYDMWEQGSATSGPGSCHEGAGCFGFNLDGNYINCQRAQLISPAIDLSSYTGKSLKIEFMHWYNFWASPTASYDGGFVEFSNDGGTNWSQITGYSYPGTVKIYMGSGGYTCVSPTYYVTNKPGFTETSGGNWQKVEMDIPADMMTSTFKIRFVFSSGIQKNTTSQTPSDYSYPGWYIDDVTVMVK